MQHHVAVVGLEVGPQAGEEGVGLGAGVHVGRVAAGRLRRLELQVVLGLVRLAHRHVADLLEVHRVGLPHLHAGPQDGVQRAGHVQVADAAAGQPGGARARALLVDQHHVAARALAGALQVHGQVVGAGQAVHARADHHEPGAGGQRRCVEHRDDGRVDRLPVHLRREGPVGERVPLVVLGGVGDGDGHFISSGVQGPVWSLTGVSR